jgi:hypothetical protein
MGSLNIYTFGQHLSAITVDSIHGTSVKEIKPIKYSLVTCFKEASKKRVRADE